LAQLYNSILIFKGENMKFISALVTILTLGFFAHAELPFTKEAFQQSQKSDAKILLHFHADWCPTCKIQKKVLATLDKEGFTKGLVIYTVDYDKETDFKKELNVNQQSTFVAFYGGVETGRSSGITSEADIKKFISEKLVQLTLGDQLRMMKAASSNRLPPEKAKIMADALAELQKSHMEKHTLKVGQKMPDFALPDSKGKTVDLKNLLKNGPVIVTFYRGSWCPYCNVQLNSYQQHLAEFKSLGATLVAITPEKPDLTTLTSEKKKLEFSILTDKDNAFANKIGLVFKLNDDLKKLYSQFGIDLEKNQGNADWKLPMLATYVVSKKGKVIFAFADADYTKRAEPQDIIEALKKP
jgi:peroxiredoxin/glutaredoxin